MEKEFIKWGQVKNSHCVVKETFAVRGITEKSNSKGPYVFIDLFDGNSTITATIFGITADEVRGYGGIEGELITAEIISKGNGYLNIQSFAPADPSLKEAFVSRAPIDTEEEFEALLCFVSNSKVGSVPDTGMAEFTCRMLSFYKDDFIRSSAACSKHHDVMGGLLYHTVRMVRSAAAMAEVYPSLNKELLICGTALHDIGKIMTLNTDDLGIAKMNAEGVLFDHLYKGAIMVRDFNADNGHMLRKESLMLLSHMIVSHHGTKEFGAIQPPAIPEAMVLNFLDLMDSRMYMFEQALENVTAGSLSDFHRDLGTSLYKPNPDEMSYDIFQ